MRKKFPQKESNITELAAAMIWGLLKNPAIFPKPPVHAAALQLKYRSFKNRAAQAMALQAAAASRNKEKERVFIELKAAMKKDLRYAEHTVKKDPAKLKLLGWAPAGEPRKMNLPGQVRYFRAVVQEDGTVSLSWQPPAAGGEPEVYQVQGRPCGGEVDFKPLKTEVNRNTTIQLAADPGEGWELRVVAINACGNGPQSNTQVIHPFISSIV